MRLRLLAVSLISILAVNASASAADIAPVFKAQPVPAAPLWAGFYIGGYGGYANGKSRATGGSDCPTTTPRSGYYCGDITFPGLVANQIAVSQQVPGDLSSSSSTWGGYIGHNWQSGNWVIGAETDLGTFKLGASRQSAPVFYPTELNEPSFTLGSSIETDWLFTARGRFGWAVSNLLIYGTGGVGITRLTVAASFRDNVSLFGSPGNGTGATSTASNRVGYVVGGGLEWAMTPNWIIRGEYLFMDFGSSGVNVKVTNPAPDHSGQSNSIFTNVDLSAQVWRVGLSYKFN